MEVTLEYCDTVEENTRPFLRDKQNRIATTPPGTGAPSPNSGRVKSIAAFQVEARSALDVAGHRGQADPSQVDRPRVVAILVALLALADAASAERPIRLSAALLEFEQRKLHLAQRRPLQTRHVLIVGDCDQLRVERPGFQDAPLVLVRELLVRDHLAWRAKVLERILDDGIDRSACLSILHAQLLSLWPHGENGLSPGACAMHGAAFGLWVTSYDV